MRLRTRLIAAASGAALLIGGGVGVVYATTGSDHGNVAITRPALSNDQRTDRDETATDRGEGDDRVADGTVAERATAAATAAVPGATVHQIERDRDADHPRVAYEVELVTRDGSTVEVKLDANYKVIRIDRDHPSNDTHDRDD
jgi:uncharacterized membrane protein YkoI